jgi:hypothetical protein
VIGTAVMIGSMLLFHFQVEWNTPLPETMGYMALFGVGLGLTMQTLTLAVQNAVPPQDMGVATASATFFRQLGATAGTAIFLSVLFSTVKNNITNAFAAAQHTSAFQQAVAQHPHALSGSNSSSVLSDSSFIQQLPDALAAPFKVGFADSMHLVFLIASCVAALAFVLSLVIKEVPLRKVSGIQARAAEEADKSA